jgi:enoyl-CoA hydratase/carnithine racemase
MYHQVHFGAMWPLSLATILRAKVGNGQLQRKIALEGYRFSPKEALELGLLDHIVSGNTEAVLAKAAEVADSVGSTAKEGVWGIIKVFSNGFLGSWEETHVRHCRQLCIAIRWRTFVELRLSQMLLWKTRRQRQGCNSCWSFPCYLSSLFNVERSTFNIQYSIQLSVLQP